MFQKQNKDPLIHTVKILRLIRYAALGVLLACIILEVQHRFRRDAPVQAQEHTEKNPRLTITMESLEARGYRFGDTVEVDSAGKIRIIHPGDTIRMDFRPTTIDTIQVNMRDTVRATVWPHFHHILKPRKIFPCCEGHPINADSDYNLKQSDPRISDAILSDTFTLAGMPKGPFKIQLISKRLTFPRTVKLDTWPRDGFIEWPGRHTSWYDTATCDHSKTHHQ